MLNDYGRIGFDIAIYVAGITFCILRLCVRYKDRVVLRARTYILSDVFMMIAMVIGTSVISKYPS